MSTLPGTGIGMFAGKNFDKGESIMSLGDHMYGSGVMLIDVVLLLTVWDGRRRISGRIKSQIVIFVIVFVLSLYSHSTLLCTTFAFNNHFYGRQHSHRRLGIPPPGRRLVLVG